MTCPNGQEAEDEDDLRAEAEEAIRSYAWAGEYDPEEVCIIIGEEIFGDDEEQEEWIQAAVRRTFVEKRKAEKKWPKVTDCDRLDRAFEALEKRGVITDHDSTAFTQSDGLEAVDELYADAGGPKSAFVGYCFFTSQDLDAAIVGGGLWLAYGSFPGRGEAVEVGRLLREEFERAGFKVEWDGNVRTRVFLPKFRWQRRSPR